MIVTLVLALACAPEVTQTSACAALVTCTQARDIQLGLETDVARFDAAGDCWGSPAGQELCNMACENGLTFLRERYTGLPAECAE